MQTLKNALNESLRLLESRSGARAGAGTNDRAPRGPFQRPADGTSLRDAVRFWSKVRYGPDCWGWTGTPSQTYGNFLFRGRQEKAHRVAYRLTYGPIGILLVMHRCDNPRCVRPSHLRLGTHQDNALDMHAKGRQRNQYTGRDVCQRGHNDWISVPGGRKCRSCRNLRQRERRLAKSQQ